MNEFRPDLQPPDILRAARVELVVTDLARAREFWVDLLGLVVTHEDDDQLALRSFEEFAGHNLLLRRGPVPGCAAIGYRVRSQADLGRAVDWYRALGREVRRADFGTPGIHDAVRVSDPLGFTVEFFHRVDPVERLIWRYDLHGIGVMHRFDHVNVVTPDVDKGIALLEGLGFGITEDIRDTDDVIYAAWARRKPTVHDIALTGGAGPRLHHLAFACHETGQVLALCDRIGALGRTDLIERGPGRHGVSNAFYLYLRDPDGHRIELYTQDYYTGDPDNPRVSWDVHDPQRRDWWGNPVVPSWYCEATPVLDLDGEPVPVVERPEPAERDVVGADGFIRPGVPARV